MAPQQSYDLLVIGAGAAGSTAATTAAQQGRRVLMIERDKIGGTCLNYGCDPTKTLLSVAALFYKTQRMGRFGLYAAAPSVVWEEVQAYVKEVIKRVRGGTSDEARIELQKSGVEVLRGDARFVSPHEVVVKPIHEAGGEGAAQTVFAERIIIATGNQTTRPPIKGLQQTGYITNVEAVTLPSLPGRLAIIGGGAIGIEFAQMFRRFGVAVTVLEHNDALLSKEDRELAAQLIRLLHQEGIHTRPGIELLSVERTHEGKRLSIRTNEQAEEQFLVDEILLAVGRQPAIETLNIAAAGIHASAKGIPVDAMLRTNVPHIWAAGDVIGGLQFTHLAYEQGKLAAQNAFAQQPQHFGERIIPWVTYTDPPLAHVGKTEEELRDAGVAYKVGRMHFKEVERAIAQDETAGLVKILVDTHDTIIGGHILGARADDLLAPLVVAMQAGLSASKLASTILPYPTLSEGVRWAADRIGE